MPKSTSLRDRSSRQPELPGARSAPSSTFIEAIRRTPCGSLSAKTWLVFIASYCRVLSGSPEGKCWPSLARLAADAEGSVTAVKRHNARLVALGWLVIEHGVGNRCTFRVRSVDAVIARPVRQPEIGPSDSPKSGHQTARFRAVSSEREVNGHRTDARASRGAGREAERVAYLRAQAQRIMAGKAM
jgi:hypothetical protein